MQLHIALPAAVLALVFLGMSAPAAAQDSPAPARDSSSTSNSLRQADIISLYQQERIRVLANQHIERRGAYLPAAPPAPLYVAGVEELREILRRAAGPQDTIPAFRVTGWYFAKNLHRGSYRSRFRDTDWAYLGSNHHTTLDTMLTRELRARLEGAFGAPTRTHSDFLKSEAEEESPPQFEYWFTINGSIPFRVMDVNGPFERGLVVSTSREHSDELLDMRQAFLKRILEPNVPAAYADYYYEPVTGMWFVTGYDGDAYFLEPVEITGQNIGRPDIRILELSMQ